MLRNIHEQKGFNAPVTALSGRRGSAHITNEHVEGSKSAYNHTNFVNMAAMFFSCNHVEATTWKRQGGSDNLEATTWHQQPGNDNLEATTWKRQLGSDNLEATTRKRQLGSDNSEANTWERQLGSDNVEGGGGGGEEPKIKLQKFKTAIVLCQSFALL